MSFNVSELTAPQSVPLRYSHQTKRLLLPCSDPLPCRGFSSLAVVGPQRSSLPALICPSPGPAGGGPGTSGLARLASVCGTVERGDSPGPGGLSMNSRVHAPAGCPDGVQRRPWAETGSWRRRGLPARGGLRSGGGGTGAGADGGAISSGSCLLAATRAPEVERRDLWAATISWRWPGKTHLGRSHLLTALRIVRVSTCRPSLVTRPPRGR